MARKRHGSNHGDERGKFQGKQESRQPGPATSASGAPTHGRPSARSNHSKAATFGDAVGASSPEAPIGILFVCHGNICRSTMAEFVMKDLVNKAGLADRFHIESAATSTEEIGNPVYPGTRHILNGLGIDCSKKRARQIRPDDYETFDLIIAMDDANVRNLRRAFHGDPDDKVSLLLSHAGVDRAIADPWYTDDFDATYRDVKKGCDALLDELR